MHVFIAAFVNDELTVPFKIEAFSDGRSETLVLVTIPDSSVDKSKQLIEKIVGSKMHWDEFVGSKIYPLSIH